MLVRSAKNEMAKVEKLYDEIHACMANFLVLYGYNWTYLHFIIYLLLELISIKISHVNIIQDTSRFVA